MTRDLASGDLVSATPHYNQELDLPEPIDLIRFAPFGLANYYKYIARDGYKDDSAQEIGKLLWYTTDMAVATYVYMEAAGRPFLTAKAHALDLAFDARRNRPHPIFAKLANPTAPKYAAMKAALNTITMYASAHDAPQDSVERFAQFQSGVLGGLRDMLVLGYAYAESIDVEVKPLSKLYLGTRSQDVPAAFFDDVFPNHRHLTHGKG